jgi:hypothetical protein
VNLDSLKLHRNTHICKLAIYMTHNSWSTERTTAEDDNSTDTQQAGEMKIDCDTDAVEVSAWREAGEGIEM